MKRDDVYDVAIAGAGIAGLHLALYLQQRGVDATIITDREPEEYRDLPLLNTVAHHATTLEREAALGVDHWADSDGHYGHHDHCFNFAEPLHFQGYFTRPSRGLDHRIYLPRLMDDFLARGGNIEYRRIEQDDIAGLAERFDLVVVAVGKGPLGALFTRDEAGSPFTAPQRHITAGLFTGVRHAEAKNVTLSATPEVGEAIVLPIVTFGGLATAILLENLPGTELTAALGVKHSDDPESFLEALLDGLERFHPLVYDRIDTATFDVTQPADVLQGALVPTVRKTAVELPNGTFAVALGDVHATLDPLMGQGANVASYAAFVLGEEIVAAKALDREFVERVNRKRAGRVLGAMRWTNLMLGPPSDELQELIGAMSRNRRLCDEFTDNFNRPEAQWENLGSPERIRAWIDRTATMAA